MEDNQLTQSVNTAVCEKLLAQMASAREEALACARRMGLPESMAHVLVNNAVQSAERLLKTQAANQE